MLDVQFFLMHVTSISHLNFAQFAPKCPTSEACCQRPLVIPCLLASVLLLSPGLRSVTAYLSVNSCLIEHVVISLLHCMQ